MVASQSFVLVHVSLSRMIVNDLPRRLPTWAPIEFYAAFRAMDSVDNCLEFMDDKDMSLSGWRLFSNPVRTSTSDIVQFVTGFEPLFIRGEAIAYARTAAKETFSVAAEPANWGDHRIAVPQELLDILNGGM